MLELLLAHRDDHQPTLSEGLSLEAALSPPRPAEVLGPAHLGDPAGDPNDLAAQRWGVVVPEGPSGDRLLSLIEPLRRWREEGQGAPVRVYRAPANLDTPTASRWSSSCSRCWPVTASSSGWRSRLPGVDHPSLRACRERQELGDFPARGILEVGSREDWAIRRLMEHATAPEPGLLFSLSHVLGAPGLALGGSARCRALPKAALANPQGPLTILGHMDLAWTYSFQDPGATARSRPLRFMGLMRAMVAGRRAGVAAPGPRGLHAAGRSGGAPAEMGSCQSHHVLATLTDVRAPPRRLPADAREQWPAFRGPRPAPSTVGHTETPPCHHCASPARW